MTTADPAMSHFMSSMPAAGLIEMPPVSKVTPLPIKASGAVCRRAGAVPLHDDEPRRPGAALRDAEQRAHAEFAHRPLVEHLDLDAELLERPRRVGKGLGIDHVGRLGDEVAGKKHRLGSRFERPIGALGRFRRIGRNRQPRQRRLFLGLLLGPVFVEAIGAQRRAEGHRCRGVGGGGGRTLRDIDGDRRLGFAGSVQMRRERPAELLEEPRVGALGLAETGQHDAAERQFRRRHDRQQLALFAAEPGRRGERAGDRPVGCLVEPAGGRRQRTVFPDTDDGGAGTGQVRLGKGCFHHATSSWRRERCRLRPRQWVSLGDRYINRPGLHQGSPRRNVAAPGQGWPQLLPMPLSQSDGGT